MSANNGLYGILAESFAGMPVSIMVRNTTVANNAAYGLAAEGPGATLSVTRSTITGNGNAFTAQNSGVVSSYADNNIDGNGGGNVNDNLAPTAIPYK